MPELHVLTGPLQWKTVPLRGARFLIGRQENCQLLLRDGWVSRQHTLIIEPRPGEFFVQDLDSENGTWLNGERIREQQMKHGDVLRVGRTEMRFVVGATSAVARPGAANTPEASMPSPVQATPHERTISARTPESPANIAPDNDFTRTRTEPDPKAGDRPDLRDRVRKLEHRVLELEEKNSNFAAENTVLKRSLARAGMLDPRTGAVGPPPASLIPPTTPSGALLRCVVNPSARIDFPDAAGDAHGLRSDAEGEPLATIIGVVGLGRAGGRAAAAFAALGHRRALAVLDSGAADAAALGRDRIVIAAPPEGLAVLGLAEVNRVFSAATPEFDLKFAPAFRSNTERVIVAMASDQPFGADFAAMLIDHVGALAAAPVTVLLLGSGDAGVGDTGAPDRVAALAGVLDRSTAAGRITSVIAADRLRTAPGLGGRGTEDTILGVLDTVLRVPLMPALGAAPDVAAVRETFALPGWAVLSLAASSRVDDAGLAALVGALTREGLTSTAAQLSLARAAVFNVMIGSEILAKNPDVSGRLESALAGVRRVLPQVRLVQGFHVAAGNSIRVTAFVGGLPVPERIPS